MGVDPGAPPGNRVEPRAESDVAVVALVGESDVGQYDAIKSALATAAARASNVVVDFSACTFIDSTTIMMLMLLQTHTITRKAGGGLVLVIPAEPGPVSHLAERVRRDRIMSVHPSLEAAIASVGSKRVSVVGPRDLAGTEAWRRNGG